MHKKMRPAPLKKFRQRQENFCADFGSIAVANACERAHAQPTGGVPVAAVMIDGSFEDQPRRTDQGTKHNNLTKEISMGGSPTGGERDDAQSDY